MSSKSATRTQHIAAHVEVGFVTVRDPLIVYASGVVRVVSLLALAACGYTSPSNQPPGEAGIGGEAGLDADAAPVARGDHLLISEVFSESGTQEYFEIYNPLATAYPLADVYVSDCNEYWKLPGVPSETIATSTSDFLMRFPNGTEIPAGGVIVVAIDGPAFVDRFSVTPSFTIRTPTAGATPMLPVLAPGAAIGTLSDDGELLVVFEWDGASDRVSDVDIIVHGMPNFSAGNGLVAKQPVDGPDGGGTKTAYEVDANPMMELGMRTVDGTDESYRRIALDELEQETGGNGVTGHDETTERLDMTWTIATADPGVVPF